MSTIYRITNPGKNHLEVYPDDRSIAYYINKHDGVTRNKLLTFIRNNIADITNDTVENKEKISRSIDYYISKAFDDGFISFETNKRIMNPMRAYL